jgi:hypothetical protein
VFPPEPGLVEHSGQRCLGSFERTSQADQEQHPRRSDWRESPPQCRCPTAAQWTNAPDPCSGSRPRFRWT